MPRARHQKAVSESDFIASFEKAETLYNAYTAKGDAHRKAKQKAYKDAYGTKLTEVSIDQRAAALQKTGRLASTWNIRKRSRTVAPPRLTPPSIGAPLVTYHHDTSAQCGVYYTIVLDRTTSDYGEIAYIGKAEDAFGARLLTEDKHSIYTERITHGSAHVVESRCLVPCEDKTMVLLENWITRCWGVLTCRLPTLHTIKERPGKALTLQDLKVVDLAVIREAVSHLATVGLRHEQGLWTRSARGSLDIDKRMELLFTSLTSLREAINHGMRISRESGTGRDIKIFLGTELLITFSNTNFREQWLETLGFSINTLATDTTAGKNIAALLVTPKAP